MTSTSTSWCGDGVPDGEDPDSQPDDDDDVPLDDDDAGAGDADVRDSGGFDPFAHACSCQAVQSASELLLLPLVLLLIRRRAAAA